MKRPILGPERTRAFPHSDETRMSEVTAFEAEYDLLREQAEVRAQTTGSCVSHFPQSGHT